MIALKFSGIGLALVLASGIALASEPERAPATSGDSTFVKKKNKEPILIAAQQSFLDRILSYFSGSIFPAPNTSVKTTALASPAPSPSASPDFKMQLWTAREGFQVQNPTAGTATTVTTWNAQSAIQAPAVVSRYSADVIANVTPDVTVTLASSDDLMLRQKMTQLMTTSPGKPSSTTRDTCAHWVETESFYGKRFFCDGESDSADAMSFVSTVKSLVK